MIQWAAKNLTPDEINAFNASVNSGNSEPTLVKGIATGDATAVFRSTAELTAAMKDPNPAYRQDIIEKLGRSSIF